MHAVVIAAAVFLGGPLFLKLLLAIASAATR
jgi:hypothetical protein